MVMTELTRDKRTVLFVSLHSPVAYPQPEYKKKRKMRKKHRKRIKIDVLIDEFKT